MNWLFMDKGVEEKAEQKKILKAQRKLRAIDYVTVLVQASKTFFFGIGLKKAWQIRDKT